MPITINGSGSITGISAGGLPDDCITTADIAANAVTYAKLGTTEQGQLCKAWVHFAGNSTVGGFTATVTRTAGSTTATVTADSPHGLTTGNVVYATSGVAAGAYTVTVVSTTVFTITTVATTALTNAAITFAFSFVRGSFNVSSVADVGIGQYRVNFKTAMVDSSYAFVGTTGFSATAGSDPRSCAPLEYQTSFVSVNTTSTAGNADCEFINVAIFR